jgi:hypothetical protein
MMSPIGADKVTQKAWRVRYTWKLPERSPQPHPEHTYESRPSETAAIDCAVSAMDRNSGRAVMHIVSAHIQAPGSEDWRLVEEHGNSGHRRPRGRSAHTAEQDPPDSL